MAKARNKKNKISRRDRWALSLVSSIVICGLLGSFFMFRQSVEGELLYVPGEKATSRRVRVGPASQLEQKERALKLEQSTLDMKTTTASSMRKLAEKRKHIVENFHSYSPAVQRAYQKVFGISEAEVSQ